MIRTALAAAAFSFIAVTGALANPASQDPAKVPAGNYVLDKRHASLLVKVPHMGGFSKFTMRFDRLDGSFAYDPATWATTKVTITADPTSINTGLPDFDKTIAGPSYFDSAKYPAITFVSTKAEGADGKGTVSGDLTFHGVTKPVVLDVTFNGVGPGMMGAGTRIGFSGSTHLKRSDFGVTTMSQFSGDDLDLLFEVEFVKK
ncbi:YceI family protein [soil metagenome]